MRSEHEFRSLATTLAYFDGVMFDVSVPPMLTARAASSYQARGLRAPDARCPVCGGSGEDRWTDCFTDPISVQYGWIGDDDVCVERTDCICTQPDVSFASILQWHRDDEDMDMAYAMSASSSREEARV